MPVAATAAGCVPIALPPLSPGVAATVTEALYGVELAVEAALRGDRSLLVQALAYDRHVVGRAAAEKLADDLLRAHAEHLPQF
jgi:alpha-galactosidase